MYFKKASLGLIALHFSLSGMTDPLNRVLVIPVQYHVDAQEWYVLVGQNSDSFFGGFSKKITNETPYQAVTKALTNQTNALYHEESFSFGTAYTIRTR